jgi:glutamate dehydrogenase
VPHDTYGMTSLSIRQFVLGIYKQLGLREKDITKVQTGGPGTFGCSFPIFFLLLLSFFLELRVIADDVYFFALEQMVILDPVSLSGFVLSVADGSVLIDEIFLSSDKTIAIIDGSGVLADPTGINREELIRLAKRRQPVSYFNKSKLSKDGYLVKVEEQDVRLPCQ